MQEQEAFLLVLVILSHHVYLSASSDPDPIQDFCIPKPPTRPSHHHHFPTLSPPCKNSSEVTTDDFVFSGVKSAGNFSQTGFAAIHVSPLNFPGLNTLGMSFVRADFKAGAINPPHSHPRATEIAHVVKGRVYSGFVDSDNRVYARVVEEGEVMVFPKGLVHFQMNVGDSPATVFGILNSQSPGTLTIPSAIFGSGIDGELLVKAFGMSPKQIGTLKRRFEPEKGK